MVYHPLPRMLSKNYVNPNRNIICILCQFFSFSFFFLSDCAFGRSCIRIVNKIGTITEPYGGTISIFF